MASGLSRRTIATAVAKQLLAGKPQGQVMRSLAALLTCDGRLEEKDHILRDVEYVLAENGSLIVRLRVARVLSSGQLEAIRQTLQRYFQVKHIELKSEVDPELIGGLVISTPLGSLDSSLTNQLANLVKEK